MANCEMGAAIQLSHTSGQVRSGALARLASRVIVNARMSFDGSEAAALNKLRPNRFKNSTSVSGGSDATTANSNPSFVSKPTVHPSRASLAGAQTAPGVMVEAAFVSTLHLLGGGSDRPSKPTVAATALSIGLGPSTTVPPTGCPVSTSGAAWARAGTAGAGVGSRHVHGRRRGTRARDPGSH